MKPIRKLFTITSKAMAIILSALIPHHFTMAIFFLQDSLFWCRYPIGKYYI